jgi:phage tail sheath gpL-like
MPISFNRIPANWRNPLYWVEVDSSKAGLPISEARSLLVGLMNQSGSGIIKGSGAVNVPVPIASKAQADAAFGQGSHLAMMFNTYFANNWANETWGLPLAEGTTAATGTITITGAPSAAGTYDLYIAGINVSVGIGATDSISTVATNVAAAINSNADLPVTAVAGPSAVTLTSKFKGTVGNDINLSDNYYGNIGGEFMPAGLTVTYTPMASGAGDPTHTTAISNLGENETDYVCMPFTDQASLTAWENEFGFSDTGRWGFVRQHFGQLWSAKRDTFGNLQAFAPTQNCPQLSVLGIETGSPTPTWQWAAAYTAMAARALSIDPARPLQTLQLTGCLPAKANRFLLSELNALSIAGIATQRVPGANNVAMISRESTTYSKNLYGQSDDAYESATTLSTLTRILRNQRQAITSKFPRSKLADDGTRFGAGQAIVTPLIIKAELVAQYRIDEFNGLVENGAAFKDNLIVERDANDPNRVNVLYPPDLVNQLRIFAVLAQFRLQYNRGIDTAIVSS